MSAALPIREVEKPWGKDTLPAPFAAPDGKRIGEIWFEPPPALPQLLVKYIFTSEALSVQVHPSDAETLAKGLGRQGKEECWLIVDAEPEAKLGIGFKQPLSSEALRTAAQDGSIEDLMQWHKVRPGDFFYIPAGTVHAIGAGVSLIEVQQNSDITYRLYDYGRPRELHLDEGVAVAKGQPYPDEYKLSVPDRDDVTLVEGPLFRLDQIEGLPNEDVAMRYGARPLLVIPRQGAAKIGSEAVLPGGCGLATDFDQIAFDENGACLIAQPLT
ncbi:class I mannose-6-phosphate isomerase [Novosphingobium sp. JCM 18896]|uniref:class I mannose-6-phosphate isomerase n=1 Tax=Novosphingobium sp. JCM 18896 TaxID=2989731 RepID=UPI00222393BC|nr:class I mannose-6-phosphate isomerase [Novosphingobium sp. JCM 18896]MCW1427641.1 class I mannose-6-phosphate isomerase [Novosphingobium sp. JCM 18896]